MAVEPQTSAEVPHGHVLHSAQLAPTWTWEMDGPPGAPTLLLLHGWMATAALNWYASLPYLSRQFRVVAPDLRGHGRQGGGSPPFSLDGCSDDLAALIDELGIHGAIAVGYSMGGAVAQVLARRHCSLLGGVALCATAATFARRIKLRPLVRLTGEVTSGVARRYPGAAAASLQWWLAHRDRVVAAHTARGAPAPAPAVPDLSTMAASADGVEAGPGPLRGGSWSMEERRLSHLAAYLEAGAELNAYDSSSWLPTLDLPAAVLVTARDRTVPPWRQEAMAALIPGARRYPIEAGHDAAVNGAAVFLPVLARACTDLALRNGGAGGAGGP